ncbi:MAG: alpha-L-fucosidase, partial [Bacteroidales bacterium]|nr:alpha-L-fucosidase [Bacteroidales bacterium]
NRTYCRTLRSALSHYGPVFEMWFDGANGEGPNGKRQVYDWKRFHRTVRRLQPQAVMFSDVGPGCRWVGNEEGMAGLTNWSRLDVEGFAPGAQAPPQNTLTHGNRDGACWVPAETDVSIRTGWFYRDSEHPKSLQELLRIYYTSVGRNSLLLLNVPPDSRGLIPEEDAVRLREFRRALDSIFAHDLAKNAIFVNASDIRGVKEDDHEVKTIPFGPQNLIDDDYDSFWTTEDTVNAAEVIFEFAEPQTINRVVLQEYIPLGQRVECFHVEVLESGGTWRTVATGTTIGHKRIMLFDKVSAVSVRIVIDKSRANPILNRVGFFLDKIYNPDNQNDIK